MEDKPKETAPCPFMKICPMFPVFESQLIPRIYQSQYCTSRYEKCERYKLASHGTMPPPELLPDGDKLTNRD